MLTGGEIRERVHDGLASGKLWRLAGDHAKLRSNTDGGRPCHVCDQTMPRGPIYALARASAIVFVHLECYLFWLRACGLYDPEPVTCASCRRLIPPHAERTFVEGEPHHRRCWDRAEDLARSGTDPDRTPTTDAGVARIGH